MQRDSLVGTFVVATVLCLVCSFLVSLSAVGFRDRQQRNKDVDRKKNILLSAALCDAGAGSDEVDTIYEQRVRETLIDLATGEPVAEGVVDAEKYDARKAAKDPGLSTEVAEGGLPGISRREKYASVYEIVDGETVEGYIFPVYGKGLWSTLYGFVALQADGETVRGITFYEHAETPGLGGEVDNATWKAKWPGKTALKNGEVQIQVLKGQAAADSPNQIDGLAGATITTKGVHNLVRYWLGEDGFGPYLANKTGGGHGHGDDGHGDDHHNHEDPKTASNAEDVKRG